MNKEPIRLENEHLLIEFDPHTGGLCRVLYKDRQIDLIERPDNRPPWEYQRYDDHRWYRDFVKFEYTLEPSQADALNLHMSWDIPGGLIIIAQVDLPMGSDCVIFHIILENHGSLAIDKLTFPVIPGIGQLNQPGQCSLVHSQGSGFIFYDPYYLFEYMEEGLPPNPKQGLRYSPYPEGYQGATMQFMSYAGPAGGFYFVALDGSQAMKWINYYKGSYSSLEASFIHQNLDIRPGGGLAVKYPVVISTLDSDGWCAAADRYKGWAVSQPWCKKGPLHQRQDRAQWLLEEVGFSTFGINAANDRSGWLDRLASFTEQPVFHILGVNWPKNGGDYHFFLPGGTNNLLGGKEDWFPARFHSDNLKAIRSNHDYWAPFEFNILFSDQKSDSERIKSARLKWPQEFYCFDDQPSLYLCPAHDYLPDLHVWRDTRLVEDYQIDALYYDFSTSNMMMTCFNESHGHPLGGGAWMVSAIQQMYADTKQNTSKVLGRYCPQGSECIHELMIPYLDYYQARAEACPLSPMEADFFREWIKAGKAEKIPLFAYVYHEYGPIRLDGWAQLTHEIGDLFYWVAARVTLWGGLLELNYEFTPLENLGDIKEDISEHYTDIQPNHFDLDEAKAGFLQEIAEFRTMVANPYLAYGSMLPPLDFETKSIELSYFHYNGKPDWDHVIEKGTHTVPQVLEASWKSPEENLGFIFFNLSGDQTTVVEFLMDAKKLGYKGTNFSPRVRLTQNGHAELNSLGDGKYRLELPAQRFVLVEFLAV